MHMAKLSPTHWVNLDTVVDWWDSGTILYLVTMAVTVNEQGHLPGDELRLEGDERDAMLRWLESISVVPAV